MCAAVSLRAGGRGGGAPERGRAARVDVDLKLDDGVDDGVGVADDSGRRDRAEVVRSERRALGAHACVHGIVRKLTSSRTRRLPGPHMRL